MYGRECEVVIIISPHIPDHRRSPQSPYHKQSLHIPDRKQWHQSRTDVLSSTRSRQVSAGRALHGAGELMRSAEGYPEPGKTTVYDESETIDLDNAPLNGGFLVKTLYLSIDPYLRGKMRDPKIESYSVCPVVLIRFRSLASDPSPQPAYLKGKPLDNFGIGIVLRSENVQVKAGDHVYGIFRECPVHIPLLPPSSLIRD